MVAELIGMGVVSGAEALMKERCSDGVSGILFEKCWAWGKHKEKRKKKNQQRGKRAQKRMQMTHALRLFQRSSHARTGVRCRRDSL